MQNRRIAESPVTYLLVFDKDEEFVEVITKFAKDSAVTAAQISAIGAFKDVTLGYFDRAKKDYRRNKLDEQVEVVALLGDIALKDEEPSVHAHAVVGKSDGSAYGGHVLEAHVWPTLEVVVTESPTHLRRLYDPETGLALINPRARP